MSKNLVYIRAATNKQDVQNQRYEILEYDNRQRRRIDEFMEVTLSSRHSSRKLYME